MTIIEPNPKHMQRAHHMVHGSPQHLNYSPSFHKILTVSDPRVKMKAY
jgi:hypothetical protein